MKADPDCPLLQIENLSDLRGDQFFHVVEHENDAQRCRNTQDCPMQQTVLLGLEQVAFRTVSGTLEQQPQFLAARHQFVEREHLCRSVGRFAAHTPAAVSGDRVQPNGQLLWSLNLGEVMKRTEEHLLHVVFRVFRMTADFHAEGIDRVLE
ncbi:MAG: hypothetical protein WBE72_07400 [Terracidiphilus sp.]